MFRDPSEKSLVEILRDNVDTRIDCRELDEDAREREGRLYGDRKIHEDRHGNHFLIFNDYMQIHEKDGQRVGILVADESDVNIGVSHPHPDLPHLIGLYVREPYRGEGIASDLVHEFMETVEDDRCIVDCTDQVKPFYDQLDCEVIYLEQFKQRV